jgi:hypothetical protein
MVDFMLFWFLTLPLGATRKQPVFTGTANVRAPVPTPSMHELRSLGFQAAFSTTISSIAGEQATLEAERKEHEKKLKTADKASSKSSLPSDFRQQVEEELKGLIPPTEGDESILYYTTGTFQADSRIQKLVLDGVAQAIIANDADCSFTLGEHCIQVVDYKLDTTSTPSIAAITVKSGVYSTLQDIVDHSSKLAGKVEIKKASYPLLETMEDPHLRVCIGLGMGCDVLPWGIYRVGHQRQFQRKWKK